MPRAPSSQPASGVQQEPATCPLNSCHCGCCVGERYRPGKRATGSNRLAKRAAYLYCGVERKMEERPHGHLDKRRRRVRLGAMLFVAVVVTTAAACKTGPDVHVDGPQILTFGGHRYFGSVPIGFTFPQAKLSDAGQPGKIENGAPTLVSTRVLSLDGVDPGAIVFMQSTDPAIPLVMFIADGLVHGTGASDELIRAAPGLCRYSVSQSTGCSPGESP